LFLIFALNTLFFMDISTRFRDTILFKLQSGEWQAGDRLPTERALSGQFGISRTTVRKVFQEMKSQGLICQTVGSGTYVTDQATVVDKSLAIADTAQQISPSVLMEARLALEPAIIDLVIGNATSTDFGRMDECCAKAEAAGTVEEFEHWDGMLHELIADAAHNSFVSSVFKLMNQARAQGEWGLLKKLSLTPERRMAYQDEHRLLVGAIKDRDLVLAKSLATVHLLHVRRNLLNF
jgi:DNA-binding FadR family transcriptional regulator